MRIPKTLYVVADGGRARYIEQTGTGRFTTVRSIESAQMHVKSSELSRDRPPRVQESATPVRHAVEKKISPRDKIEMKFMKAIAQDLSEDKAIGNYDNLVLVAPARLQKVLRESLATALAAKLAKCIDKDLTKVPDDSLPSHLPALTQPVGHATR